MSTPSCCVRRFRPSLAALLMLPALVLLPLCRRAVADTGPAVEWSTVPDRPPVDGGWVAATVVDRSGNTYVTGHSWRYWPNPSSGFATARYDPAGHLVWLSELRGASDGDVPVAIAVDRSSNTYVTGYSWDPASDLDFATVKYDPAGKQLWVARYNRTADSRDIPAAMAVDEAGDVFVTGSSAGPGADWHNVTVKYDTDGNRQWVADLESPGPGGFAATGLALDRWGGVYVMGRSTRGGDPDYQTVKYNSRGRQLWSRRYAGRLAYPGLPLGSDDEPVAVQVDRAGNVVVTGTSSIGFFSELLTVAYSSAGALRWVARFRAAQGTSVKATGLALDDRGNAYVAGTVQDGQGGQYYETVRYDALGTRLWTAPFSVSREWDEATAIALDRLGNVYVGGRSDNESGTGYRTVSYDPQGSLRWQRRFTRDGGRSLASGLAVDRRGGVYASGFFAGESASGYLIVKYSSTIGALPSDPVDR